MKNHFIILLLVLISCSGYCQENITDEITPLIKSGSYAEAWQKVNAFLAENPKSIEGLIMKGNVILYRYNAGQPQIELSGNPDESIYHEEIGFFDETPMMLPADTADAIVAPFLEALKIDKTRKDIYFGICTIYSYSMQVDKLNNFLPTVIKNIEPDENMPYTLADYAINFDKRHDFDDEIKVYNKIAELYPKNAGIVGDIAAQYISHGDVKKAKEYIDLALKRPDIDKLTYKNGFEINGILENYDEAIKMAYKLTDTVGSFYKGITQLCKGGDWKTTLKKWVALNEPDDDAMRLASQLLSVNFGNTIATMDTLISVNLTDAYKIPIYKYFKEHSPYFLPAFKYAEALTYNARYPDAIKAFSEIKTDTITLGEKENLNFFMAWALYKNGNIKEANIHWEPLLKSVDFYHKSAAAYFIGKSYLDSKDTTKAKQYFSMVSDSASKSKYANYCNNLIKEGN